MPNPARRARPTARLIAGAALAATLILAGCSSVGQLVGGMAASAERSGSHDVKAKYKGLAGKTFAVIVAADRSIQADYPDAVPNITREVTRRVAEPLNGVAKGVVPAEDVLTYQGRHPGWVATSPREVAKALGVDRLIFIDLGEYRQTDSGNPYVWNGVAAGIVGVIETESTTVEDFAFREHIQVKYPDQENTGALQIPPETVRLELLRRFVNRCAWLFFDHEEKNIIKY